MSTRGVHDHHSWRDRLLLALPAEVIEYPLELVFAVCGIVIGVSAVAVGDMPISIAGIMPGWAQLLWAATFALGGASALVGLRRRRYSDWLAWGLCVLGAALLVYAASVLAFQVAQGLPVRQRAPSAMVLAAIGVVLLIRAWWLRQRERIHRQIARTVAEGTVR